MAETSSGSEQSPVTCLWRGDPLGTAYLQPRCHPESPVLLKTTNGNGYVECSVCHADLMRLNFDTVGRAHADDCLGNRTVWDFYPTLEELKAIARDHLIQICTTDFEEALTGAMLFMGEDSYDWHVARLRRIKALVRDEVLASELELIEAEHQRKLADVVFFRICDRCWSPFDTRAHERCPECGEAPTDRWLDKQDTKDAPQ